MSENQEGLPPTGEPAATVVPAPATTNATSVPPDAAPDDAAPQVAAPDAETAEPPHVPQAPPPASYPPAYYPPASSPTTAQPYPTSASPYPSAFGVPPAYPGGGSAPTAQYPAMPPPSPATAAGGAQPGSVRRGVVAGVAALAIALTGGAVGGFVGYSMRPDSSPLQVAGDTGNGNAAPVIDRSSLASIAAALQPTIVDIRTNSGEGSGVIISSDGNIVTNNHVVSGARTVTVTFNSGSQVSARVLGTDPQTDLAVVKVDADNLVHATWADSDAVQVGDTVLALGSPLGLQGSVTAGIVSGLHRTITSTDEQRSQFDPGSSTTIGDAIQTDAPINAGNSGGALVNMNGEVIGINTAIATAGTNGNIGVGFAISANRAKVVAESLIAGHTVSHPYLGVQISNAQGGGAEVGDVVDGAAAAQAGLRTGDVVTKWGDRQIRGAEDLIAAIQTSTVGAQVPVTVVRDGEEQTITVTVGEK